MTKNRTLFTAKAANGTSAVLINTSSYRNTLFSIFAATSSTGTIKIKGSNEETPAFSSAASASNMWDYVAIVNLQTHTETAGDTGVAFAASTGVEIVEANINAYRWMTVELSGYSAGAFTVVACQSNNQ